jgi:hypothetical protein
MTTDHHAFPEYHQTATPVTHGTLQINLIALSFLDARGFCILGASSAECVAKIKEDARVKRWVKACWIASLVKSNPSLSGFSIMDMHVSIVLAIV